jgi:hypothetical protein
MKYLYWVAYCKTLGCKAAHVIKYDGVCVEGVPDKFEIALSNKIAIQCKLCSRSHEYNPNEVIAVVKETPPTLPDH